MNTRWWRTLETLLTAALFWIGMVIAYADHFDKATFFVALAIYLSPRESKA
ncbi:hypothetical protein FHW12_000297 [Dokdonella fugitiva]|uniref:Uncharacterized protein n=1 Tax=Dokdonella fugitiva TaxID=328517 RepID=A0A839EUL4_9GAMM|nr:hypothetical protein [Dokdonella fugitiva]MBA8886106.1 hypothetical protein [Dokdonella fugitiva]